MGADSGIAQAFESGDDVGVELALVDHLVDVIADFCGKAGDFSVTSTTRE